MMSSLAGGNNLHINLAFLLVVLMWTIRAFGNSVDDQQDIASGTVDNVLNSGPVYEYINPSVLYSRTTNDLAVYEFIAFGYNYTVTVNENRALVRPGAVLVRKQAGGDVEESLPNRNCHFIGKARRQSLQDASEKIGKAAFHVCNGLEGSMFIDGTEIRVSPITIGGGTTDLHIIYPAEVEYENLFHDMITIGAVDTGGSSHQEMSVPPPSYIELLVAIDYDVYSDAGNGSIDITLAHINKAQAIFLDDSLLSSGVYVYLSVVKIVLFETDLLLNSTGLSSWPDITRLYSTFGFHWESNQSWRNGGDFTAEYYDVAVIFGGRSIDNTGDDSGVSSFKGCHTENHYIAMRYQNGDQSTRVLTRQLGHIVGMDDNYDTVNCSGSIMSDITMVTFDQCNIDDITQYLGSQEGQCLLDTPSDSGVYDTFVTERDRLDYACFSKYLSSVNDTSLRACPWRLTYECSSCELWCEVIDRDTLEEFCVDENEPPAFPNPSCGNNQVCDGLNCYCPNGTDCSIPEGLSLLGIYSHFIARATSYDDGREACKAEGGVLAEILDTDIQADIEALLTADRQYDLFYFGLQRNYSETNEWVYMDNTQAKIYEWYTSQPMEKYFNWELGEPNNETFAYAAISRNHGYNWIDYNYVNNDPTGAIGAVCQRQISYATHWVPEPKYARHESDIHCTQFGGALAKISHTQQQSDVEEYLTRAGFTNNERVFFDLYQVNTTWQWSDGDLLGSYYNNWKAGEPGTLGNDCAVLRTNYEWEDDDCLKNYERSHLCQFECLEDASWCHHGYVELNIDNRTCECICNPGWKGIFCLQPSNWTSSHYWVFENTTDYWEARDNCIVHGGRLAQVRSPEFDGALAAFMNASSYDRAIVGLHLAEGAWMESEGELLGEYSNWRGVQPFDKDCVDVRREYDWTWYGRGCSWIEHHVCEFECEGDTSWCNHYGGVVTPYSFGCYCQCYYGWTGEFCEEQDVFYHVIPEASRGYAAPDACRDINGRQAVLKNYDIHQNVIDFLNTTVTGYDALWFDLRLENTTWVNADGPQTYFDWLWYDEKDCAVIRVDMQYQWQRCLCTWQGERYPLCEFDCNNPSWCVNGKHDPLACHCECHNGFKGRFCTEQDTFYWLDPVPVQDGYTAGDGCIAANNGSRLAVVPDEIIHQRVRDYLAYNVPTDDRVYFDLRMIGNDTWANSDGIQTYLPWLWTPNENQDCACLRRPENYDFAPTDCDFGGGRQALCETPVPAA